MLTRKSSKSCLQIFGSPPILHIMERLFDLKLHYSYKILTCEKTGKDNRTL